MSIIPKGMNTHYFNSLSPVSKEDNYFINNPINALKEYVQPRKVQTKKEYRRQGLERILEQKKKFQNLESRLETDFNIQNPKKTIDTIKSILKQEDEQFIYALVEWTNKQNVGFALMQIAATYKISPLDALKLIAVLT